MKSKEKNYNEVSCDDQSRWGMLNDSDLACNNYYGARCIAERSYDRKSVRLDFIPNRISFKGCRKDVDKIVKFVNRHVRRIEKFVHEHGLGSNKEYVVESPEGISSRPPRTVQTATCISKRSGTATTRGRRS